mgnify:CR=1 FL=1
MSIPANDTNESKIKVGITHGDLNGISYEVIIKLLADNRVTELYTPVIYGVSKIISYYRKLLNTSDFNLNIIRNAEHATAKKINLINLSDKEIRIEMGESTAIAGEMALQALDAAIKDIENKSIDVIVTAPLNKENVQMASKTHFTGHTGYLAQKANVNSYLMLMVAGNLKIGLVTEHLPLEDVTNAITPDVLRDKINILNESLQKDFNIRKPKVAVLSLNPHAGDGGLIGKHEQDVEIPVIESLQKKGLLVYGPYPADGFFASNAYKNFDAVLAMYHDQGMIPFKTLSRDEGVNYTAGLPYVRTSPAHGTAYDIAGKNMANPDSMRAATYLACDIYNNRKLWEEINQNPLPFYKKDKDN